MPKDANGTELNAGDNVTLIKDLKVKGAGATLKRGTMVKNIKITDNDKEIEGRIDKMGVIVLKTEFLNLRGDYALAACKSFIKDGYVYIKNIKQSC